MKRRTAFTLIELLVVMAIIAVLVAILVPAVQRMRASARSTQSKSNLSELGKAMKHYEGTGRGNLKTAGWEQTLLPYADEDDGIFVDPSDTNGGASYALSNKVVLMGGGDDAKVAIVESDNQVIELDTVSCTGTNPTIAGAPAVRHMGTTNVLLYGGAVRSFEPAEIDLADASREPLVIWWLPKREHGMVCGTVVVVDNPTPGPSVPAPPQQSAACGGGAGQLVAHWSFDDPTDYGRDATGNGHSGVLHGNPTPLAMAGGKYALVFNGVNQKVEIPYSAATNPGCYSLAAWYRRDACGGGFNCGHVADTVYDSRNEQGPLWGFDAYGTQQAHAYGTKFQIGPGASGGFWESAVGTPPTLGQWRHVAWVFEATTANPGNGALYNGIMRLYENGSLAATNNDADSSPNTTRVARIGCGTTHLNPGTLWWTGAIDDVRLYNYPLSDQEVAQVMNEWTGP